MKKKQKGANRGHRQGQGDRDDSRSGGSTLGLPGYLTISPFARASSSGLSYADVARQVYGDLPEIKEAKPEPEGLPRREGDLPVMAWKRARIVRTPNGYRFGGVMHSGSQYDAVSEASCNSRASASAVYLRMISPVFGAYLSPETESVSAHSAPDEHCRCGFYGLTERPETVGEQSHLLLEVEFFGTVIVAEKGYRAQKQRVLAVHLPQRCEFCPEAPTQFVVPNGYAQDHGETLMSRCMTHVGPFDVTLPFDAVQADLGVTFA